ncbi:MAG: WGxxGxxG family protein [Allosphingosinicella sp.]
MKATWIGTALLGAAALALAPAPAFAQEDLSERANELAEQANDVQAQAGALANEAAAAEGREADRADVARNDYEANSGRDDDDGFPWGILGLLGLAGLLGLRKADRVDHVNRTDTRL